MFWLLILMLEVCFHYNFSLSLSTHTHTHTQLKNVSFSYAGYLVEKLCSYLLWKKSYAFIVLGFVI